MTPGHDGDWPDPPTPSTPGGIVLRSHELAAATGTTVRALRHYHRLGLLPEPPRDPNGYRRYSAADLVRVLRIRQLSASGVRLRRIAELLTVDGGAIESLRAELAEVEEHLATEAERIRSQREIAGRLRDDLALFADDARSTAHPAPAEGSTDAADGLRALDADLWLLATDASREEGDPGAAQAMDVFRAALATPATAARAQEIYSALAGVHAGTPEPEIDRIVDAVVDFATTVTGDATAGVQAADAWDGDGLVRASVEQLLNERLTPVQRQVLMRARSRLAPHRRPSDPPVE